jgi:signal transduction histidine kinase
MKQLRVASSNLSAISMDAVFADAASLAAAQNGKRRREDVRLVLEDAEFIDPYGLVSLWVIVRYLKLHFRRVRLVLPSENDVQSYLNRMRFPLALDGIATIENKLISSKDAGRPSDVLLEMTPLEKEGDLIDVTREILGRIGNILKNTLSYTKKDISAFSNVVTEVCNNIFDHSRDKGIVAAQRYTKKDGTKYAIIAVADLGIGIRQSLAERYEEASSWSHSEAIVKALQKEYSRRPNRGLGLFMVSKIVGEYRGNLHIRSGDARLYLRYQAHGISCAEFPGTQLAISLSVKEQ